MTRFKNREEYERWKAEKLKQAQEATIKREKYKKKQIGLFSIFYTSGEILRQTNNAKAWLYAILALLWSAIIGFGPIAIGLWLLFEGEVLKAVLIPIALYLIIGFYMAFWPFIAILIFIGGWIEYGFLESLSGTIAFVVTVFVFLSGPEWLMYRSYRAAEKAERIAINNGKQPETLLEQAQEVGGKLIIDGYRRIAAIKGCAPSSKTTDKEIIEIYSKVGSAFRLAAEQRREIIPADNLNFIVWKFFQVYEMMGNEMLDSHLQYEVKKYLRGGLRPEYRNELALF